MEMDGEVEMKKFWLVRADLPTLPPFFARMRSPFPVILLLFCSFLV